MKVAARIALTLASVALALYVAAITIRVDELDPQATVLWPYDWLWWVVIPGGLLYFAGFRHSSPATTRRSPRTGHLPSLERLGAPQPASERRGFRTRECSPTETSAMGSGL